MGEGSGILQLIEAYSLSDIIVFVVMLAVAIKAVVSFWDWAKGKLTDTFGKETVETKLDKHLAESSKTTQTLLDQQEKILTQMTEMQKTISELMSSDKDDIRSWIIEKHHQAVYHDHYIDDYTLDCMEKRYEHYKTEGGNSYVTTLMDEVRALPKEAENSSEEE